MKYALEDSRLDEYFCKSCCNLGDSSEEDLSYGKKIDI